VVIPEEELYTPKLIEKVKNDETVVTVTELVADLMQSIPREIRWDIEKDYRIGAQLLANHFGKRVVVSIDGRADSKLRKMNEGYHIPSGPGAFERKTYSRGAPVPEVFNPIDKEADREMKISLGVMPATNHYIHSAEQHTQVVNDYCKMCQLCEGSVSNTYGTGKKSSRKTKGRSGRKYLDLFHASKGALS
jgi:hypothetical protein